MRGTRVVVATFEGIAKQKLVGAHTLDNESIRAFTGAQHRRHGLVVHGQRIALALTLCEKFSQGGGRWGQRREKLTFTKVRHARAKCLDVRVERGKHLTSGFDTASKRSNGEFSLFGLFAFGFENCLVERLSDLREKQDGA